MYDRLNADGIIELIEPPREIEILGIGQKSEEEQRRDNEPPVELLADDGCYILSMKRLLEGP